METYLVYVDAANNSNKFWSAKVEGSQLTVQWGRVGYNAQTKVHSLNSQQQAIFKYYNLIAEKKAKGYQESQPQMDSSCSVADIRRALQLLNSLRTYVANHNFNNSYIQTLNEYLKIVPTPLGMQIDPYRVYQTVGDVDHQVQLLNSLLPSETVVVGQNNKEVQKVEVQTVSLKSISKNFWRNI
ncbi:WGR domain-containing protein [Nostoc sp. FACHB-145]|uniref:WGR domain-containing protein n=1 Tax=Nostoc sp. FACHB-145 TaxID=2692836 RepID=UPI001686F7AC|nr:WGR domain-containing protein [Nostoc sp. FACHB-145]MBD2468813.1 WGR domain-containing protein [Nostoc sp. FACHB-145]